MREKASGWPVPLVEIETTSKARFVTDNAGMAAFDLPEAMGREIWLGISSDGYTVPADGFGNRGVRATPQPGGVIRIEVSRTQIARRLGRLTGSGLFAESQKLGQMALLPESGITGCDTAQLAAYQGKLFWAWGDTILPNYPLGVYDGTGATTPLHPLASFEPPLQMRFDLFRDPAGAPRGIAKMQGEGPTWITACAVVPDQHGTERLVCSYNKIRSHLDVYETGLAVWEDGAASFRSIRTIWRADQSAAKPRHPEGHAVRWNDAQKREWLLFGDPLPTLRCPATFEGWQDPAQWQSLTPQETVAAAAGGESVKFHSGSIAWNGWRKRWVAVFMQRFGKPSAFGEVWYCEAPSPEGPWGPALKILSHRNYTFYNPLLHPELVPEGSPILLFEGTYTQEFADRAAPVPRYDYNQMLYRLDLDDPALALAQRKE